MSSAAPYEEAELVGDVVSQTGAVDLFTLSLSRLIRIREGEQYSQPGGPSDPFIAVVLYFTLNLVCIILQLMT